MNHVTYFFGSADISIFYWKLRSFALSRNADINCTLILLISISFNFFESSKIASIKMNTILMISAKMDTLGFLKQKVYWSKVYWSKSYDVMISVHGSTNKILSCGSNYIVDVVMWRKFGNCSISMREVIKTSIL